MDKPHPVSSRILELNLPGSLIMLRSLSCALLLLLALSCSPGESRPYEAEQSTPGADTMDNQRALLLEAVKAGILNSLGLEGEPRPVRKASEEEVKGIYQLYRAKVNEMRGNSSQTMKETWQSTTSTVLFPATVQPIKVLSRGEKTQSGQHVYRYRAVFNRSPNIQTELKLTQAELKISMQVVDEAATAQPEVKVKVTGMNSAAWTLISPPVNVSSTQVVMLDISAEVEKWMTTDEEQALVVDVEIVAGEKDVLEANPSISLELGFTQPKPVSRRRRLPRSDKEDICDEQGWCCRKSVTVSFKDIGWTDWVVAPAEYTMHFCDGTCPHNYKPASMHTQVKSRMHQITKGGTPHPCCVPAAYEPMVLMHYDSGGKLKLTVFDDFIVSKCYCA